MQMEGWATMYYFTSWAWVLLGISFSLSGWITIAAIHNYNVPVALLRAAIVSFEIAAPISLLVSTVVRYVIWERSLKSKYGTIRLRRWTSLARHNANAIFAVVEVTIFGGLPIRIQDISFSALFGLAYIFFSYFMASRYAPKYGIQFLYSFLDTTLGKETSISAIALILVLMGYFLLFALLDDFLNAFGEMPIVHIFAAILISGFVCRFRD